jgi:superfamily II DNA/RNA helicase
MFSSLLLDEPLLVALETLGFGEMTEVQQAAIPQALAGKDLVVNARTGSGKTLAYVLPMLQQIIDNPQSVAQALILAPTRELCRQINKQCLLLAGNTDITTAVIIGGEDPKYQLKALQKFPDVIIATPGRLLEHVKREVIDLDSINILVLDEADRMLDMGFAEQVVNIAHHCSEECQTVLYSASFNAKKFSHLIDEVLHEPELIIVDSARDFNANVLQQKITVDNDEHKLKLCEHILRNDDHNKVLIFANKRETVNRIHNWLQSRELASAVIHSEVDQEIRNHLLRKFRNDDIDIIVATDVASRGLDIKGLDLIINFDVPADGEDYMHRIGRTGRMFDTGVSITMVDPQTWNRMISIENFLGVSCERREINGLTGKYNGPDNMKSSGKAYGIKRKKPARKKSAKKNKNRARDRKNIGKRRKPTTPAAS